MLCPYCKKELENDSLFCSYCGEKIEQRNGSFCTQCGAKLEENAFFCSKCGAFVNAPAIQSATATPQAIKSTVSPSQRNKAKTSVKQLGEFFAALLCLARNFIKNQAIPFAKKHAKACIVGAAVLAIVIAAVAIGGANGGSSKPATAKDKTELKEVITTEYLLAEQVTYSKDGSVEEHFVREYDELGNQTLNKNVLRNAWQEWEYDEHGNLVSEAEYRDNGVFSFCVKYDITYDKDGNRKKTVSYNVDKTGNQTINAETETEYKFDKHGNIIYEKTTHVDDPDSYIETEYNSIGNTLRSYSHMIDQNGKPFIIELVYNENGDALKQYTSMYDETGKETFADIVNEYDERGNLIHIAFDTNEKENCYTIECTYDEQGNQLSAITYDRNGAVVQEVHSQYDAQNNLIYENTIKSDGTTSPVEYEYDADGNLLKKTTYVKGAPFFVDVYTYDANGNTLSEVTTLEGSPYSARMHTYDANGNVIHSEKYFGPEYNGYITYKYITVDKVTYVPVEEGEDTAAPGEMTGESYLPQNQIPLNVTFNEYLEVLNYIAVSEGISSFKYYDDGNEAPSLDGTVFKNKIDNGKDGERYSDYFNVDEISSDIVLEAIESGALLDPDYTQWISNTQLDFSSTLVEGEPSQFVSEDLNILVDKDTNHIVAITANVGWYPEREALSQYSSSLKDEYLLALLKRCFSFLTNMTQPISSIIEDEFITEEDKDKILSNTSGYVSENGCIWYTDLHSEEVENSDADHLEWTIYVILPDAYLEPDGEKKDWSTEEEASGSSNGPGLDAAAADITGSWAFWGELLMWEDESYISNPIPEEELNIDGQGAPALTIAKGSNGEYLITYYGGTFSVREDEYGNYIPEDDDQGYFVLVDENTLHQETRGDLTVYKREGSF